MLRERKAFDDVNEPWQKTSHLHSKPCLIAVAVVLIVVHVGMSILNSFSALMWLVFKLKSYIYAESTTVLLQPTFRTCMPHPLFGFVGVWILNSFSVLMRVKWSFNWKAMQDPPLCCYSQHLEHVCLILSTCVGSLALNSHAQPLHENLDALLLCGLRLWSWYVTHVCGMSPISVVALTNGSQAVVHASLFTQQTLRHTTSAITLYTTA